MIIRLGSSCTTCSLAAASSSPSSLCISAHTILLCLGSYTCISIQTSTCIWARALPLVWRSAHCASGHLQIHLDTWKCIWTLANASGYLDTSRGVCTTCSSFHLLHLDPLAEKASTSAALAEMEIGLVKEVCVEKNVVYTVHCVQLCSSVGSVH